MQEQGFCGFCIFFGMLPAPQQVAFLLDPWSRDQGLTGSALPVWWFRPHASYLRKEARCRASAKKLPKGTPWKGFLWTLPSGTPGLPGTEIFPVGRCYVLLSAQSSGVRQIWKTRLGAKQISSGNFFARAVPLPTAAGTPSPPQSPRKDFCRAKMPCGGERLLDLLPGSLIVERIAYQIAAAIQNESAA